MKFICCELVLHAQKHPNTEHQRLSVNSHMKEALIHSMADVARDVVKVADETTGINKLQTIMTQAKEKVCASSLLSGTSHSSSLAPLTTIHRGPRVRIRGHSTQTPVALAPSTTEVESTVEQRVHCVCSSHVFESSLWPITHRVEKIELGNLVDSAEQPRTPPPPVRSTFDRCRDSA